jgi:hypothetical protein
MVIVLTRRSRLLCGYCTSRFPGIVWVLDKYGTGNVEVSIEKFIGGVWTGTVVSAKKVSQQ